MKVEEIQAWMCDLCGATYAEYVNGCPGCELAGLLAGVRLRAIREVQEEKEEV